ncbi:beta-lactamase class C and other penicillin binding proteins [Longilinea arvoryzae]|uniref:Beta-lactamase class C and other penicillin binding proteins n=1 Tax=Longilinea arvoryzae TaxID=360412 RepID=A0A0S7BF72_9CHLR|nr:serine hydrolase domain-containing protein [Longilinea arvoryzae]GAP12712.1 beta-lactamase class C and other penicillin binding proteins [Longilinea arvoryzae]
MTHKLSHFLLAALCLIFVCTLVTSDVRASGAAGDFKAVDDYLTTAMRRHNIPGIALAVTQDDQIVFSRGYGQAGDDRAVTPDTPFYIGSQTKSFTAMAVMQLVEQGKLALDEPVKSYLPWFRVADEQASGQITIRQLLQHTSGLSEAGYVESFPPDTSLEVLARDLSRARLAARPGEKMQYFNPGYSLLGLLVETASGQTYGDYISAHIFAPLKMTRSFTDPAAAQAAGLAQGYAQIFMLALPVDQTFYRYDQPAGFLISSASDLARYSMALMNGGELDGARVLSPESVAQLFTPNSAADSTYGFGWYISKYYGETQITHGGDTERFHTAVLLLPQRKMSLVMLVNENHLLKDYNEYNTVFWSLAGLLTGQSRPAEGISSMLYGWGLFILWLVILGLTVRDILRLPRWRGRVRDWTLRRRWLEVAKHLLGVAFTLLIVVMIVPAFLGRGFNWNWFTGFLPDVAIVVFTLALNDLIQAVAKAWMIVRIQ